MVAERSVNPRLRRIAAVTGVPIETFFGAPELRACPEFGELVTLWTTVLDTAGRARILAYARDVAKQSEGLIAAPT